MQPSINILFLSHTASGGDFVVGSHHLAKALAELGHSVVHLSTPVTPAHVVLAKDKFVRERVRRWHNRGRKVNGFLDAVPFAILPWTALNKLSSSPHTIFGALTSRSCQEILRQHQFSNVDLILIDEPRLAGLMPLFPRARIVYRPTDLYAQMRADATILRAEKYLIERADRFVATSQPVADHLTALGASKVLVMENGVDLSHFLQAADAPSAPLASKRPVAVYTGALDDRFCVQSIALTAQQIPDLDILLVGPFTAQLKQQLEQYPNVKLWGSKPYSELPAILQSSSVALLPLSRIPANEGRSPMKLFEYAAAGLPVIATATQELARRHLGFTALAHSPEDFSNQVRRWMHGELQLQDGRSAALAQDWQAKATRLLNYAQGQS